MRGHFRTMDGLYFPGMSSCEIATHTWTHLSWGAPYGTQTFPAIVQNLAQILDAGCPSWVDN